LLECRFYQLRDQNGLNHGYGNNCQQPIKAFWGNNIKPLMRREGKHSGEEIRLQLLQVRVLDKEAVSRHKNAAETNARNGFGGILANAQTRPKIKEQL
jgi:hypothetical protein